MVEVARLARWMARLPGSVDVVPGPLPLPEAAAVSPPGPGPDRPVLRTGSGHLAGRPSFCGRPGGHSGSGRSCGRSLADYSTCLNRGRCAGLLVLAICVLRPLAAVELTGSSWTLPNG